MIDKSESVIRANVWWTLGADHLTFEGLWVISEKKYPADWFREEKACKDITGKNSILQWKNIAHYTVMYQGKNFYLNRFEQKIITQTIYPHAPPPPHTHTHTHTHTQKSHGQPHSEWGKRRIWRLNECHPLTKRPARVHYVVFFKTKASYFKIENTPIKGTIGKRKFKRMLSFLFFY